MTITHGASLLVGVALLAGSSGCQGLLGLDGFHQEGPGRSPGAQCDNFGDPSSACGQCMATSCCAELHECSQDPGCTGLTKCQLACTAGDEACRAGCASRYYGSTLYSRERAGVAACLSTHCAESCGQTCGVSHYPPECSACLSQQCCPEWTNVGTTEEAVAYAACRSFVPHSGNICGEPSTDTLDRFHQFSACQDSACLAACTAPLSRPDWSCLGSVVWPPPRLAQLDLSFGVGNFDFSKPLADIEVTVCSTAYGCNKKTVGQTDQSGVAILQVPLSSQVNGTPDTFFAELHDLSLDAGHALEDLNVFWYPSAVHSPAYEGSPLYPPGTTVAAGLGMTHVHVFVRSCGGQTGKGVVFSSDDPQAVPFYATNPTTAGPDPTQTETGALGIGGLMNVSLSKLRLTAKLAATGQIVAEVPVRTRPNLMTLVVLNPGPSPDPDAG